MDRMASQRGTRDRPLSARGRSIDLTSGDSPIAISALTYTSINASRAAQSTASRMTMPAIASTVCSIRLVNSRSEITISLLQVLRREALHEIVDLCQLVQGREEDDPEKPFFGRQAEAGSVHAQYAGRVEECLDVVLVRAAGRQRDARHRVERRRRRDAADARHR